MTKLNYKETTKLNYKETTELNYKETRAEHSYIQTHTARMQSLVSQTR